MHQQQTNPEIAQVEELAHVQIDDCYQCGKCTAGCPMAEVMDITPSSLMRLVQGGYVKKAATCDAVWLCVSCQTCSTRCPKETDPAGVIDALRQIAVESTTSSDAMARTVLFQKEFLRNIRAHGRTNEMRLVAGFKVNGFFEDFSIPQLLKDSMLGPAMLLRSKLHPFGILGGKAVKDIDVVRRIFDKCLES